MDKELKFALLSEWFQTYPGKYYLNNEQAELNSFLLQFHGYYLIQLGLLDLYDLKSTSPLLQRVYVSAGGKITSQKVTIQANLSGLPFQYESVDGFILPHTLEFSTSPDKLLNEIYNILIPGGQLIIFGFNPYSFLGLVKLCKLAKGFFSTSKFYSKGKIKHWLHTNDFSLSYDKNVCYRPPLRNEKSLKQLTFLESLGRVCFPCWGCIYVLIAQKTVPVMTPLKKKMITEKIPVAGGFPEPSTNKGLS